MNSHFKINQHKIHGQRNYHVISKPFTSGAQSCIARRESAFHAAVFNPVDSDVIATANSRKGVQLWDVRVPGR